MVEIHRHLPKETGQQLTRLQILKETVGDKLVGIVLDELQLPSAGLSEDRCSITGVPAEKVDEVVRLFNRFHLNFGESQSNKEVTQRLSEPELEAMRRIGDRLVLAVLDELQLGSASLTTEGSMIKSVPIKEAETVIAVLNTFSWNFRRRPWETKENITNRLVNLTIL